MLSASAAPHSSGFISCSFPAQVMGGRGSPDHRTIVVEDGETVTDTGTKAPSFLRRSVWKAPYGPAVVTSLIM